MATFSVKLSYKDTLRRVALSEETPFQNLLQILQAAYPDQSFVVQYEDDEKDLCVVSSDAELQEAIRIAKNQGQKSLKLFLEKSSAPSTKAVSTPAKQAVPEPEKKKAQPDIEQKSEEPKKPKKLSREEVRAIMQEVMQDQALQGAVMQLLPQIMLSLGNPQMSLADIVTSAIESNEVLKSNKHVQTLLPYLPDVLAQYSPMIDMLRMSLGSASQQQSGVSPLMFLPLLMTMNQQQQQQQQQQQGTQIPDFDVSAMMNMAPQVPKPDDSKSGANAAPQEEQSPLRAAHVSDVTLADFFQCPPNRVLTKTWKLRNNGKRQWPEGTHVVFTKGSVPPKSKDAVNPVKPIAAGEYTEASVDILTPSSPGKYTGNYSLATADGKTFGDQLFVEITVVPEEKPAAKPEDKPESKPVDKPAAKPEDKPAAKPVEKSDFQYAEQLQIVMALGVDDVDLVKYLLVTKNGDIQACVDWLMNNNLLK